MNYQTNRDFSDKFIPTMKDIVGPRLLETSTLEVDCEQAADLVVLRNRSLTIACRVRRHGYAEEYPNQFTIRLKLDNGEPTEFKKMYFDGWADWMLYGHQAEPDSLQLDPWWIINLDAWRTALKRESQNRANGIPAVIRYSEMPNGDGTHFIAFEIASFPKEPALLIARS